MSPKKPPRERRAKPRHDPVPGPKVPYAASARARFWRIFRLIAVFAILVAGIAVAIVAHGEPGFRPHMWIATALGTGLTVLVGGALMSLIFLSASSGHDEEAGRSRDDRDYDQ